jgi:ABC-type thiamine transport system ATPase subunit
MGRAIVRDLAVFLFDEPLSNLDAKLRVQMRLEIKALQRKLGVTSLYVTHVMSLPCVHREDDMAGSARFRIAPEACRHFDARTGRRI